MRMFVVYDAATGDIKRAGFCQDCDYANQALESGEVVTEPPYGQSIDPNVWRVDLETGEVVPK